jgi:hypothetical protein
LFKYAFFGKFVGLGVGPLIVDLVFLFSYVQCIYFYT